jgi:hypothetical protein
MERPSMQSQNTKKELLGEARAKIVSQTIKELTPLGVKIETNGEGSLTGPHLNAKLIETINIFQKTDGTFEWEDKAIIATIEGETIITAGRGTGKATGPATFLGEGEGLLMTQSPRLASMNGKRVRTEVSGDRVTGEYHVKLWAT